MPRNSMAATIRMAITRSSGFSADPRNFGNPRNQEQVPVHALGSGFIVSPNGVILTNAHVVHGATQVTVTLMDHREFKAKVLGEDAATDVAVVKIDAKDLPTVHMTASSTLQVGDYVLAIGAPYGLEETATAGIVSAKGRSLNDRNDQNVQFIQTDVAVNPGNSGGPLFDAYGNVVGINSQIYSNTGGFEGVSFAIPIEVATHDEESILKTGKVEHARLGVMIQPVNQSLAKSFHLDAPVGALVSKVDPDSAAARAGLQGGRCDPRIRQCQPARCRSVVGGSRNGRTRGRGEDEDLARWQDPRADRETGWRAGQGRTGEDGRDQWREARTGCAPADLR